MPLIHGVLMAAPKAAVPVPKRNRSAQLFHPLDLRELISRNRIMTSPPSTLRHSRCIPFYSTRQTGPAMP